VMPVTGLPLPFVSYGGSNLLTNIIAVALLMNIESRRYVH
ncbi:MAG: FtsW/RodA/SpoVE family cell cycle protein, partial [Spirochaetota bacterium]|jgi:rod shape determining protein RodA|nr:FtsW/RodA/SpoVE family cell cycle protein [Spirochaetota bacterium]